MKNKKLIILAAAVYVAVEISFVIIGLWPIFFYTEEISTQARAIRVGIEPVPSRGISMERWDPILKYIDRTSGLHLVPYYARSSEEVAQGLANGRLDLALATSAVYREAERKASIRPLLVLEQPEPGRNRAVLVTRKPMDLIKDTRGARLTFVDKLSLSGYFIPERQLREKIPMPLATWFSSISFAGTHAQAVADMMKNKTDIIATNWCELDDCVQAIGASERDIRIIWTSYSIMPRYVLCSNRGCLDDGTVMSVRDAFLALPATLPNGARSRPVPHFSRTEPRLYEEEMERALRVAPDQSQRDAVPKELPK